VNDLEFKKAYEEQNRRDQIAYSTTATVLSVVLNLFCSLMDYCVYKDFWLIFFMARLLSVIVVLVTWAWFRSSAGRKHHRIFGAVWYASPLAIILWMIYYANDPNSPYYAGLNIVLLAVGLLSPWTYIQNSISAALVIVSYVFVCFMMPAPQPHSSLVNNTTFLLLTAVIVVAGSIANSRQRLREFSLRFELDRNKKILEENNRKLIELDQLKSRFFANVSHELRTPLTLLLAPMETLIQTFESSVDEKSRELLQTMHRNGMRLLKLINDLLDLIRLESGRLEVKAEPLPVNEFVSGLASAVRQVASTKSISVECFVDPELGTMLSDHDKLEKIALNLLFNATKFTPNGGHIWLRAEKQGEHFILIVKDNGVGIAEKSLPFVFDRFWQEDSSSKRKFQGVGIGLALVKELAEAQGGTTTVDSQEGKGATFIVKLPYKRCEDKGIEPNGKTLVKKEEYYSGEWLANLYRRAELFPANHSASRNDLQQTNSQRPLILVADDEPDMRRFLRLQLMNDYDLIEALDGEEAAEKSRQYLPDLILLDLMMPNKDGLQVCRELREYAPTTGIPVILLTARADEEAKFDALQIGANDFLAKPFSSIELQARVKNMIERHLYQRRISKQNKDLTIAIEQIKETESQLVHSEKLASLGRMSAGIIHEINNPLNFATTALFTLRKKAKFLPAEHQKDYADILKDVEEGVGRVKTIVSDLRVFARSDSNDSDQVPVGDIVAAALRFLDRERKADVQMEQDLSSDLTVWANKNKLIHILANLLQNSLDALKTKTFTDEKPTIRITGREENGMSILTVRDNGPGIAAEHLNKIYDPFFTTKDVGAGMGLGLSICYRLVQEAQGKISAQTEPGKFCEFTLEFPAHEKKPLTG
jgi:signal transduction histidine kinase